MAESQPKSAEEHLFEKLAEIFKKNNCAGQTKAQQDGELEITDRQEKVCKACPSVKIVFSEYTSNVNNKKFYRVGTEFKDAKLNAQLENCFDLKDPADMFFTNLIMTYC